MIEILIPAVPVAQPRCKAARIGGFTRVYTPKTADTFKALVALAASQVHKGAPLDGNLRAVIRFVFPRPKTKQYKNKPMPREYYQGKKDIDNLQKSVFDALNGILWIDDRQIVAIEASKTIASGEEQPHVLLKVEVL